MEETKEETQEVKTKVHYITKKTSWEELKKLVGGYIEIAYDDDKTQIICNEEGKLLGLPYNIEATKFWDDLLRKRNPESNNSDILNGDIVILTGDGLLE